MKLALFVPSLRGGGAERVMVNLANGFVEMGHKVDLVLVKAEGPYLKDVDARVNLVDLGSGRVLRSLPRLVRYMRKSRPDAMISALNHANVIAVLARMISRVALNLVVTEHNTIGIHSGDKWSTATMVPWCMRMTYKYADAVVAVSHGAGRALANYLRVPEWRIHVIYNPIVDNKLLELANQSLRDPWILHSNTPFILSVGRLTPQKDYETLLKSFAQLRRSSDVRLVVLGEGELRRKLQILAEQLGVNDALYMPGFVQNPYSWMRECAVFVLSSAWEGFGNVLVEAMACGAKIVSTNCPSGPAEILENGKWGRLVPVGDTEAMRSALLDTLWDSGSIEVIGKSKQYSVQRACESYLSLLEGRRA